jgi:hypothetical protein
VYPHPAGAVTVKCVSCHATAAANVPLGAHAAMMDGAPECGTCHADPHEIRNTKTPAFYVSIPEMCGACHQNALGEYRQSVHADAVGRGIVASPVCSSCHRAHDVQRLVRSDSTERLARVPETCGSCHGDVRLTERFSLPNDVVVSFAASFHGLALKAGSQTVANCASCHGAHMILPSSNPKSTVHPANLPTTCGQCHPGAG